MHLKHELKQPRDRGADLFLSWLFQFVFRRVSNCDEASHCIEQLDAPSFTRLRVDAFATGARARHAGVG